MDPIDLEEIWALDRANVIHPIAELRKQEQRGAKIFVAGRGVELELADGRVDEPRERGEQRGDPEAPKRHRARPSRPEARSRESDAPPA